MKRIALCFVLLAQLSAAEVVYLSARGKTYHARQSCMALSRAKQKLQAERSVAVTKGRKSCGICYRAKAEKKAAGAPDWATPAQEGR